MNFDNAVTLDNLKKLKSFTPEAVQSTINEVAQKYAGQVPNLGPALLSMANLESNGFQQFVGKELKSGAHKGDRAIGPFQYMKATADGKKFNRFDLRQNVENAAIDLVTNYNRFGGRLDLAIAAHQTGPNRPEYKQGIIPGTTDGVTSTKDYTSRILQGMAQFGGAPDQAQLTQQQPAPPQQPIDLLAQKGAVPTLSKGDLSKLFKTDGGDAVSIPQLAGGSVPSSGGGVNDVLSTLAGVGKRNTLLWQSLRALFG